MKQKIGFIADSDYHANKVLKNGLQEKGHQTWGLTSVYGPGRLDIQKTWTTKFLPLFLIWFTALTALKNAVLLYKATRKINELKETDAIFVSHLQEHSIYTAKILGLLYKKPVILASHRGLYSDIVTNQETFKEHTLASKFIFLVDNLIFALSDKVICVTHSEKQFFQKFYYTVSDEKLEVNYVGVEESKFTDKTENLDVNVVYWGSFLKFHGIEYMIEAAAQLPNLKFVLCGESVVGSHRQEMMEKAERIEVENVEFPGYVSLEKLSSFIQSADIALGTFGESVHNEYSINHKVAEAAFMQKPVVTGSSIGLEEVFTCGESIWTVENEDVDSLVQGLRELSERPDLRRKLARNARNIYQEFFTPERKAERFIRIVEKLGEEKELGGVV